MKKKKNQDIALDTSTWAKPKLNGLKFLSGVTKLLSGIATGTLGIPSGNLIGMSADVVGVLESVGFEKNVGQLGWRLISRSLLDAFYTLISESIGGLNLEEDFLNKNINKFDDLDKQLNKLFETEKFYIYPDFFKHPEKLPLLSKTQEVFDNYLKIFNFDYYQRGNILRRLGHYFVFSLVEEWRKAPAEYSKLTLHLNTPFADAQNKEYQWMCYRQSLIKEIHKPVFQESFDLQDIYIPLRAYYEVKDVESKHASGLSHQTRKELIEIDEYLLKWIKTGKKEDYIKIISGGPGYGKSSLLKMVAAQLAEKDQNVLFIPLHRFELKDELEGAIKSFLNFDKYITTFNPLDEESLVIIFDGLDELDMQGGLLADLAQRLLREVQSKIQNYNHGKANIKVIVSGRDVIVQQSQSDFRGEQQILKLLPYLIDDRVKGRFEKKTKLLDLDQRHIWWQKYGELKNTGYADLPSELRKKDLDELTSQPLLNYLVALSYERKKIDFTQDISLNKVYKDLLDAVYDREYSGGCIKSISALSKSDFIRLLEEIAVSAWHGNGRKTSIQEIRDHFQHSGLNQLLDKFVKDAEKGVVSLLAAFYFRQAGQQVDGLQTFEFTHKSFGEYLTASRIISQVKSICKKRLENKENYDDGYDIPTALHKWIKLFGPKALDRDIVKFMRNEVASLERKEQEDIQTFVCELINYELKHGLPVDRDEPGPKSYREQNQYAINAEQGFFVLHSLVAMETDVLSNIQWQSELDFGNLLKRIVPQKSFDGHFICDFFNHLGCDNQVLHFQDLYETDLRKSSFADAGLMSAVLENANLSDANLSDGYFFRANLESANLRRADLTGADLRRANLTNANLTDANFTRADLIGANLTRADLTGANLEGADLTDADLRRADLTGANLTGANLIGAKGYKRGENS